MPYCFPRSSIKFQGHTVQNITDFDPNWAFPDYRPVAAFKSLRFALFIVYTAPTTVPTLRPDFNPLAIGRSECDFKMAIFNLILRICLLMIMLLDECRGTLLIKSTSDQEMARCRQTTDYFLWLHDDTKPR